MDESPAQLADDDGARGCRSPPWRRLQGVSTSPSLALSWLVSLGKSLDSELDRHDGGVLDVVSLLGASCLKTRLGAPLLSSSSACCSPRLIFRGVMHAIASESKVIPSWDRPSSATYLFRWCVDKESPLELLFFEGVQRRSRRGFVALLMTGFIVVFVFSVVVVFGLAGVELCYICCLQRVVVFLYSNLCLL
jgi:hypothetical protein